MNKWQVLELQRSLNSSGFAVQMLGAALVEDGIYGPETDAVYSAWLDRDQAVPSVTPQPVKPWWTHKALLGGLATMITAGLAFYGLEVDSEKLSNVLVAAVTAFTGALSIWGALREQGGVDPTLVARAGARTLRLPRLRTSPNVPVADAATAYRPADHTRRTGREDLERWGS